MPTPSRIAFSLAVALVAVAPVRARAQGASPAGVAVNTSEMTLAGFPGMPTCSTGAVLSGNPQTGGSFIYAKLAAGCVFPWHWHTPTETLMIVSGEAHAQMKDGKPAVLKAGAFAVMPARHVHKFGCPTGCSLYVHSDTAFDMHYVDEQGNELSPEDALKPLKETPASAPAAK